MVQIDVPEVDYTRYTNRQLVAIPLAVLVVSLAVIGGWYVVTGAPANLGVEFTGGAELRVTADDAGTDAADARLDDAFTTDPSSIQYISGDGAYVVTFRDADLPDDPEQRQERLSALSDEAEAAGFSVESESFVSASFGAGVATQALAGVGVAFLGMSVLVFAMFRSFVPSLAIVASAFSDLLIPVAMMNLLGIEMTLGTVAALLMIIGYSVDSDILLNNSVLRRTGGFYESVSRAMRTGVTMTLTSIAAMLVMTVVAWLFGITLLRDIGVILAVGLCADLMNTYLMNVSLLRWYKFEGVSR